MENIKREFEKKYRRKPTEAELERARTRSSYTNDTSDILYFMFIMDTTLGDSSTESYSSSTSSNDYSYSSSDSSSSYSSYDSGSSFSSDSGSSGF